MDITKEIPGAHNKNVQWLIAGTIALATVAITFGPFLITAIDHYQSKEQRELTKKLTKLQIAEAELKLQKLRNG